MTEFVIRRGGHVPLQNDTVQVVRHSFLQPVAGVWSARREKVICNDELGHSPGKYSYRRGKRTFAIMPERFCPLESVLLRDERVPEVDEHPRDADDAVHADQGLGKKQSNSDALEKTASSENLPFLPRSRAGTRGTHLKQRRNLPHVNRSGAQSLSQGSVEREQRHSENER